MHHTHAHVPTLFLRLYSSSLGSCQKKKPPPSLGGGEQNSERVGTVSEVGVGADEEDMADDYVMA